ncbi:Uncharacterized protein PBTT_06841 [Plasmodiophora brassicae]
MAPVMTVPPVVPPAPSSGDLALAAMRNPSVPDPNALVAFPVLAIPVDAFALGVTQAPAAAGNPVAYGGPMAYDGPMPPRHGLARV